MTFMRSLIVLIFLMSIAPAQNPIRFSGPINLPTTLPAIFPGVWAVDLTGSAHPEIVSIPLSTIEIVDRRSSATPATYFGTIPNSGTCDSLDSADMNGDGFEDLVIVGPQGVQTTLTVMINSGGTVLGDGTIFTSTTYPAASINAPVHAVDIDNDGDFDVICGNLLWLNSGTGALGAPTTLSIGTSSPIDVAPGDVDGDGDQDLVSTFISSSASTAGLVSRVLRRNASGSYTLTATTLCLPGALDAKTALADVSADGKADLIFIGADSIDPVTGHVRLVAGTRFGSASPYFAAASPTIAFQAEQPVFDIELADLDGNGRLDLLSSVAADSPNFGGVTVLNALLTDLSGALTPASGRAFADYYFPDSSQANFIAVADEDLDGRVDVIFGQSFDIPVLLQNQSAGAGSITPRLKETLGSDVVMFSAASRTLHLTIEDAADEVPLCGQLLKIDVPLPGGGIYSQTRLAGDSVRFTLPSSIGPTPVSAGLSSQNGYSQPLTIHGTGTLVNRVGFSQTVEPGSPLSMPIAADLVGDGNTPLVGVRVELRNIPPGLAFSSTLAYTDASGHFSFSGSGPANAPLSLYALSLAVCGEAAGALVNITVTHTVITIDGGLGQIGCPGLPFAQPISGSLTDGNGHPIAGESLEIFTTCTGIGFLAASTTTASDGSFAFQPIAVTPCSGLIWITRTSTGDQTETFPISVENGTMSLTRGDNQTAYAGETFALPLVVSVMTNCGPFVGVPIQFQSLNPGITISATNVATDASGQASVTATASPTFAGTAVVRAVRGSAVVNFHLAVRRLSVITTPTTVVFVYNHDHAGVPLIFAVDAPGQTPTPTPWGTITTSILAPGPSFLALDGLGIFGPQDATLVTNSAKNWVRTFPLPPVIGLTFTAQMYGYDLFSQFPYEYIVSNPVTFSL